MQSTRKLELNSIHFIKIPTQYFVDGLHKEAFITPQLQEVSLPQFIFTSNQAHLDALLKNIRFLLPDRPVYHHTPDPQKPLSILNFLDTSLKAPANSLFIINTESLSLAPSLTDYKANQTAIELNYMFPEPIPQFLEARGYEHSLIVEGPGQFSIKSGVLDFFSPHNLQATRCELFGDTITSLFKLDIETQISTEALKRDSICNCNLNKKMQASLLEYIPKKSCIWNFTESKTINATLLKNKNLYNIIHLNQNSLYNTDLIELPPSGKHLNTFVQRIKQKSGIEKKFYLKEQIKKWLAKDLQIILSSSKHSQSIEIKNLFLDMDYPVTEVNSISEIEHEPIYLIQKKISSSFILEQKDLVLLRAKELLNKKITTKISDEENLKTQLSSINLNTLKQGDLVTHLQHGIGRYLGLKFMNITGQDMEFVHLEYKDKEKLYVPVYKINNIKKYIGNTTILDKLGSARWQKAKTQVSKRLQDISLELLELYAARKNLTRPLFSPQGDLYKKISQDFPYKETKDQATAIASVLKDLQKPNPMDRLICGDVGFGKTEVALRACARAIEHKKQVAILVPTTVLSFQHHKHFQERMQSYGIKVCTLNRFVPIKKQKEIVDQLKKGEVDVIIGTHKLLNAQLEYKDLGLLIIDEEQKFGVRHKEKIKQIKKNVDTLTLSATPIPRTLNFSLLGLKDINLIQSPPQNRLAIRTFINSYNKNIIKEAIEHELKRGGQVFFLNNKIKNIELISAEIKKLVPSAKISFAHGQMIENQLEKQMLDFANKKIDVLVCTSIIESGLDIPNANTLIVNNAHLFGLSQLYQIRGRVGRSSNRAYCYLLIPPQKKLEEQSLERLYSIRDNTKLGSGIQIAQKDLELRGAGDLLGEEQSGTLNAIGYELYLDLLEEAVNTAKNKQTNMASNTYADMEPDITLPYACLIPNAYISEIRTKLYYYKKIASIKSIDDMDTLEEELRKNFSKPPQEVYALMGLILIKNFAKNTGILSVTVKNNSLSIKISDNNPNAEELIKLIQTQPQVYQLSKNNTLRLAIKSTDWGVIYSSLQELFTQN